MAVSVFLRLLALVAACTSACLATPLAPVKVQDDTAALMDALGVPSAASFRVDVHHLGENVNSNLVDAVEVGDDDEESSTAAADGAEPTRQLSPTTQSFLSTLGTALGPIVGAIVGPLLTNIGQNLAAGSGAQAIAQLQQAAQAAVAAQQIQNGIAAAAAVSADNVDTPVTPAPFAPSTSRPSVSVTPPSPPPRPARPTARPSRPSRPGSAAATHRPPTTRPAPPAPSPSPPRQTFDAFVLDVPGRGPFLFLMTPNVTAEEQSAAIQQAQQQAAQLLAVNGESSPIGAVAALLSSTPRPQVTKPTSVGPLPVRPVNVTPAPAPRPSPRPTPLPSYHKLVQDDEDQQQQEQEQGEEEVAVADADNSDSIDEQQDAFETARGSDRDFSSQSFLERLFPEMM